MKNSPHVPLGEKTREGSKSGVTRLDHMKHGSGIRGRDDRSSGIEIRIAEALGKINPTDPLILAKQAAQRNLNCSWFFWYLVSQSRGCRSMFFLKKNQEWLPLVQGKRNMRFSQAEVLCLFFSFIALEHSQRRAHRCMPELAAPAGTEIIEETPHLWITSAWRVARGPPSRFIRHRVRCFSTNKWRGRGHILPSRVAGYWRRARIYENTVSVKQYQNNIELKKEKKKRKPFPFFLENPFFFFSEENPFFLFFGGSGTGHW